MSVLGSLSIEKWEGRRYDAAVVPQIAELDPRAHLSADAIESVADAQAEVRAFEREVANLPVAMPAVLLRTESASSSQIENLSVSARNLAQAVIGMPGGKNGNIVAANVAAMTRALDVAGGVSVEAILSIHRALLEGTDDTAGHFRREQVWVGRRSMSPHLADFVPPQWERVESAIHDFVEFARGREGGPLLRAAVAHAQFETIHPFADGNGRTGRALVHTMLRAAGVVESTVPVSAGILGDIRGYVAALGAYRAGEVEPIVDVFADSARAAVINGRFLAADVKEIRSAWHEALRARRDSTAWRLADALFAQPVVNSAFVASHLGVSLPTAIAAIDRLVDAGMLTQTNRDRRNRVWQAEGVLDAMDEFAERARRGML